MERKTKILALLLVLNLPLLVLTMYLGFRIMKHPVPTWPPYFLFSYFVVTIISAMVLTRGISTDPQPETMEKPRSFLRWIWKVWSVYLVVVWLDLFLWFAHQTILGELKWQRSVPASAFLLLFIAIFSWSFFKDIKGALQNSSSSKEKTASKT
jgi:hypothetical protein